MDRLDKIKEHLKTLAEHCEHLCKLCPDYVQEECEKYDGAPLQLLQDIEKLEKVVKENEV